MCLLITAFSAVLCLYLQRRFFFNLTRLATMFSAAAVMWLVDCTFAKFAGEDFFDLSFDDTFLGITVVFCAVVLDLMLRLPEIVGQKRV